jgi:hypothetical protein
MSWRNLNKEDIQITKYTNSSPFYSIQIIHLPTGIKVEKDRCKSYFRDELPLWEELEKLVTEALIK